MTNLDLFKSLQDRLEKTEIQRDCFEEEAELAMEWVQDLDRRVADLESMLQKMGIHPYEELFDADYEDIRRRLDRLEVRGVAGVRVCEVCGTKTHECMKMLRWVDSDGSYIPSVQDICYACIEKDESQKGS